jgi:hypothetical protein
MESENDPPDRPLVDQSRWRLLRVRHIGCSKKVNPTITDHDCCGRCRQGRDCLTDAQRNYDGTAGLSTRCREDDRPLPSEVMEAPGRGYMLAGDLAGLGLC